MCGILFIHQKTKKITAKKVEQALKKQAWRGPDNIKIEEFNNGEFYFGHNRLSILDITENANQPFASQDNKHILVYNGEIYNHMEIRNKFEIHSHSNSDTATLSEYISTQEADKLNQLQGMFSFVTFNKKTKKWLAARDQFGIKPLFYFQSPLLTIIASEEIAIREILDTTVDTDSLEEWRKFRFPCPGHTFFKEIKELLPGHCIKNGTVKRYYKINEVSEKYDQEALEHILFSSVKAHELSDVPITSFLSGGIDSAVIYNASNANTAYSIGTQDSNEFSGARQNNIKNGNLQILSVTTEEIHDAWQELIKLRKQPLSLPNEAMIYLMSKKMGVNQKVILTGEGADEIFFGYDRIYRETISGNFNSISIFLDRYCYNKEIPTTDRFYHWVRAISTQVDINFVEDFFLQFHLPNLLRRMDRSTMAASKEARVPFVDTKLIEYMYRRNHRLKINSNETKLPLREICKKMNLLHTLKTPKIGFSTAKTGTDPKEPYRNFQQFNLEMLEW